jgi:hypothetical protein
VASRAGRLAPRRFRTEGPRRVALRPLRQRDLTLTCQLFGTLVSIVGARERCEEVNEIVDTLFRQGEGLDVLVEIGIMQPVALVVVVDDIPQRLLRAVVKIRPPSLTRCANPVF